MIRVEIKVPLEVVVVCVFFIDKMESHNILLNEW